MADFRKGDTAAANRLVELLYPELRKLAAAKMKGERSAHTWQPTLLVNELYLALVKIKALGDGGQRRSGKGRLSGSRRTRHEASFDRSCASAVPAGGKVPAEGNRAKLSRRRREVCNSWKRCSRAWPPSTPSSAR